MMLFVLILGLVGVNITIIIININININNIIINININIKIIIVIIITIIIIIIITSRAVIKLWLRSRDLRWRRNLKLFGILPRLLLLRSRMERLEKFEKTPSLISSRRLLSSIRWLSFSIPHRASLGSCVNKFLDSFNVLRFAWDLNNLYGSSAILFWLRSNISKLSRSQNNFRLSLSNLKKTTHCLEQVSKNF